MAEYNTFRSNCKKCHSAKGEAQRVKKRCEEMNCNVEDYRENWKKQYSETRTKYPEITHLPKCVQWTLRKWIDNGYVFTTYEQYKIDCRKQTSKLRRKYDYGDIDFVPVKARSRCNIENLTDAYVALSMNFKTKEVPKGMIKNKRLILKLKRELKLTNYGS